MCGIAGIIDFSGVGERTQTTVERMITLLRHRGPDQTGLYRDREACLGHARLSILGLAGGLQPMGSGDGRLWIVYNGEVFNYLELQAQLEARGYRFTTGSDTEVVLALYQEYGPECLSMLNGQFALAIWDRQARELFLARDRVGILPLFYTTGGGRFRFASEPTVLFADPAVERRLDSRALSQIFTFWSTLSPLTAFSGIADLPPGHWMKVGEAGVGSPQAYWQLPIATGQSSWRGSVDEAAEELRRLLGEAIRLRLRADVPVGAYLSGGLDSSIITALISRDFNNRLRTFSLGFAESPYDESVYQQELLAALGTEHSEIRVDNQAIHDHFPEVVRRCGTPLLRTGPVPLYALSRLVRDSSFKVVLTGEGADEVFGGYNIFKEAKLRAFWARQPGSKLRPLLVQRLYPYVFKDPARAQSFLQQFFAVKAGDLADPCFSHQVRWRNTGKNRGFFSAALRDDLSGYQPLAAVHSGLPENFAEAGWFGRAQYLEMKIFLASYLLASQGDRVAMGNSIELRVPYLDHRVIEFAAAIPAQWKIKGLNEKYLLKKAFGPLLPKTIATRAKQPYRAPIREAFTTDRPGSWVGETLAAEPVRAAGYFDEKKVELLARRFHQDARQGVSEVQNMALIGILSTQLLHRHYIDEFRAENVPATVPDRLVRPAGPWENAPA